MKIIGIIAEYNPFHNGHIYHIQQIKHKYPNSCIILVLSGNFTQRGDLSLLSKWEKTKIALLHGIDLVIELPFVFAVQGADKFAQGAIQILKAMQVEILIFGSEQNQPGTLKKFAQYEQNHNISFQELMKQGYSYPKAFSLKMDELIGEKIETPNDLLGISYIKAIYQEHANMEIDTIQRTNSYHSTKQQKICSATAIRHCLKKNIDIKPYLPFDSYKLLTNYFDWDIVFPYLKYKIISCQDHLTNFQSVTPSLATRIQKAILTSDTIEECIQTIKSKNYTYSYIKRMLLYILIDFYKKDNIQNKTISYIRLLGFSEKGKNYLNKRKKEFQIPILSKWNHSIKELQIELKVTMLYAFFTKKQELIKQEYQQAPIQV